MGHHSTVSVATGTVTLPTYLPAPPDKNPMFLDRRVYQGSSGKVYPLPFTDRIAARPAARDWRAVWLENAYLRVLILPEIGGRIHAILDKATGCDLIYHQHVIKPALVGLAGPWISGGIEFNWPQHHRPATFLPADFDLEEHADGSKTVWCGDHDPMARMKGMHGVCLHPGRAVVEVKARAYNRTPLTQTFLWWANVATRVHEAYQSFFPPDVYYVADHARRSMSDYPLANGIYYGVNYRARGRSGIPANEVPAQFVPPHCSHKSRISNLKFEIPRYAANDLSFYANIPVPTSYMCMGSREDFFGGYDYAAGVGIVHVANHHISPGKKQWTWGNHEFGYAWDRNLTDKDARGEFGPYIEIMAGVYTDNQPDFSFLQPGETKTWSQFWYPIHKIGPARQANLNAAVVLDDAGGRIRGAAAVRIGVSVTRPFRGARVELTAGGARLFSAVGDLAPGLPFVKAVKLRRGARAVGLRLRVLDREGGELICYEPKPRAQGQIPPPASEPPVPADIAGADELYVTGLHLEQYRHATRSPSEYWREALRRDPLDSRCNNAMGLWHLRRGEYAVANAHFRRAIERLTRRNPNPYDGEAYYHLGICLRLQLDAGSALPAGAFDEAYAAFYKATWNQAWAAASFHALSEMDCRRADWGSALDHLDRSLRFNADNLRARNLKAMVLRKLDRAPEAAAWLSETRSLDALDWWSKWLRGDALACDLQVRLDLAHDLARGGFCGEALALLGGAAAAPGQLPDQSWGAAPMVQYTMGWLAERCGDPAAALAAFKRAGAVSPDYCFPARLEEIGVLEAAMRANPGDPRAPYYLGNLLYDRRRHAEAIRLWKRAATLDPAFSVVWRNLGIGYFNILKRPRQAGAAYDRAFRANPADARLLYERDQLWKRLGRKPALRLRELERFPALITQRDDLSLELCDLLNQTGRHAEAAQLLAGRHFQPWEGGEGGPLGQHVRTTLALGREALAQGKYEAAARWFETALASPPNLGEARHLLANQSDIRYWAGVARSRLRQPAAAKRHWLAAAVFKGDFQEMSVRGFSELTYYSALSLERLGRKAEAGRRFRDLLAYARRLGKAPAKIDYFATSLPAMLLFEDDLEFRRQTASMFLEAQAWLGLGRRARAQSLLNQVLKRDPNHALAADQLTQLKSPLS